MLWSQYTEECESSHPLCADVMVEKHESRAGDAAQRWSIWLACLGPGFVSSKTKKYT